MSRNGCELRFDEAAHALRVADTLVPASESRANPPAAQEGGQLTALVSERLWEQDAHFRFTALSGGAQLRPAGAALGLCRWEQPNAMPLRCTWQEHIDVLRRRLPFKDFEYRAGLLDAPVFISVTGEPVYDSGGRFEGYRGTAHDITRRVLAEEEVRRSSNLLKQASALCGFGGWRLTTSDWMFVGSQETGAQLGLAPDGPVPIKTVLRRLVPHSRRALIGLLQKHSERFEVEVRATKQQGQSAWLRVVGETERDPAGNVIAYSGAAQDVTEQKEASDRLQGLSNRLTTTLESITDGFFTVDREWRFTYVNPEFERATGRSRAEMLGMRLWEVFPKAAGGRLHEQYSRALNEGVTIKYEDFSPTLERWLRITAYPSEQGLAVHFSDVSEKRRALEALHESEERYRLLFESSLNAVLQTKPDGEIVRANSAACLLFRMSEAELCALGGAGLIASGYSRFETFLAELDASGKTVGRLNMRRADGECFQAEVSGFRYTSSNGQVHSAMVLRDVTTQLAHERSMAALNATLSERVQARTAELEASNEELKAFAHSLAHDVRAPIAAIEGFSAYLEEQLEGRLRQYASRVRAAAKRLDNYVGAMLSLAKISHSELVWTRVDLSSIAEGLLAELRHRQPGRSVEVDIQPGMGAVGDLRLLRVVVENLLQNAWKFTSKTESPCIRFMIASAEDRCVTYCVRDNGAGFSMAFADKLFGSFQRLHSDSEFPGTGIGLAGVKRIVERHGGQVWAEGVEGAGAAFYFTLLDRFDDSSSGGELE